MKLDAPICRRLFAGQRVARLATTGPEGPHLVPIVFAFDGEQIVFAVDDKPKSTRRLRRLENLASNATAAVLADHYEDEWDRLWWVRADVSGVVSSVPADVTAAVTLLAPKYPQYVTSPPGGPVVRLEVRSWTGWAASAAAVADV